MSKFSYRTLERIGERARATALAGAIANHVNARFRREDDLRPSMGVECLEHVECSKNWVLDVYRQPDGAITGTATYKDGTTRDIVVTPDGLGWDKNIFNDPMLPQTFRAKLEKLVLQHAA